MFKRQNLFYTITGVVKEPTGMTTITKFDKIS